MKVSTNESSRRLRAAAPSGRAEGFVDGDPRQPRCELRAAVELTQVRIRVDVRLLHHVFCFALVPENRRARLDTPAGCGGASGPRRGPSRRRARERPTAIVSQ
jgi:hypothetical protein